MNILCSTDDNYVPYCGIMLTSLLENNKEEHINIYILIDVLQEDNIFILNQLQQIYNCCIKFINVTKKIFANCPYNPSSDHISTAAYYRLAVANLLPSEIDRVLYLDCDIIVHSTLTTLYNTDINGYSCGIVADEAFLLNTAHKRLNIPKDSKYPYFNSGVILINLTSWRENDTFNKCMRYITQNASNLTFHDQDTLNGVLFGLVKYLKPTYNLQTGFLFTSYFADFAPNLQKEIREAISSPVIIHYTGYTKPWQEWSQHPYTQRWLYYKKHSLWKDIPLIKSKFHIKPWLIGLRNEIIWKLGIKPRPKIYIIAPQL